MTKDEGEDNFGHGTISLGAQTWRVSNTGARGRVYLRAAVAGSSQPTIQYPVSVAKEIRDALTEAINEIENVGGREYAGIPTSEGSAA